MSELEIWQQFEEELARALGGKGTPGSGSGSQKADVRSAAILCEAKAYNTRSTDGTAYISAPLSWLETVWTHAKKIKRVPMLALRFADNRRLMLIPYSACSKFDLCPKEVITLRIKGRTVKLSSSDVIVPRLLYFEKIEGAESLWMTLSWSDLELLKPPTPEKKPKGEGKLNSGRKLQSRSRLSRVKEK